MPCLIIDTSTDDTLIAIDHLKFQFDATHDAGDGVFRLITAIQRLGLRPEFSTIEEVIVGIGPGSYTGLRTGFAAAKMHAYAKKLPLIGISSLFAFAPALDEIKLTSSMKSGKIAAVIDARGGGIYAMVGSVNQELKRIDWLKPIKVNWLDVAQFSKELDLVAHPLSQTIKKRWERVNGSPVQWMAKAPSSSEFLRSAHLCEKMGSWATHYREVELDYLK